MKIDVNNSKIVCVLLCVLLTSPPPQFSTVCVFGYCAGQVKAKNQKVAFGLRINALEPQQSKERENCEFWE
jgi:hypothetical protein